MLTLSGDIGMDGNVEIVGIKTICGTLNPHGMTESRCAGARGRERRRVKKGGTTPLLSNNSLTAGCTCEHALLLLSLDDAMRQWNNGSRTLDTKAVPGFAELRAEPNRGIGVDLFIAQPEYELDEHFTSALPLATPPSYIHGCRKHPPCL
jgi:hypothetical protein